MKLWLQSIVVSGALALVTAAPVRVSSAQPRPALQRSSPALAPTPDSTRQVAPLASAPTVQEFRVFNLDINEDGTIARLPLDRGDELRASSATMTSSPAGLNCTGVGVDRSGVHLGAGCALTYAALVAPGTTFAVGSGVFTFHEAPALGTSDLTVAVEGVHARMDEHPSIQRFAILSDGVWHTSRMGNDGQLDSDVVGVILAHPQVNRYEARTESQTGEYRRLGINVRPAQLQQSASEQCTAALADQQGAGDSYRFCVDARQSQGGPTLVYRQAPCGVTDAPGMIVPNRSISVATIGQCGIVTVSMTGTAGYSTGTVDVQGFGPRMTAASPGAVCSAETATSVSVTNFAPRVPGAASLTVKRDVATIPSTTPPTTTSTALTLDAHVPAAYVGAVRLGISGLFGGARQADYAVETAPGAMQSEIVQRSGRSFDAELVLGFALFLGDLLHPNGGRIYGPRRNPFWYLIPSPFFGVSIVGVSGTTTVTPPGSIYLGLEWEIARGISIAPTLVFRNVHRLVDGVQVGQPWPSTSPPTFQRDQFDAGFGLVINVSPAFFNVMRSPFSS